MSDESFRQHASVVEEYEGHNMPRSDNGSMHRLADLRSMQHTSVVGPAETGLLPVVALSSFLEGGAFLCSFPCLMSSKRELPCCPPIISSSISNSCWALRRRCDLSSSSYGMPISVLAAMANHKECLQCTLFTVC